MRHSQGVLVQLLVGRSAPDDVAQARDVVARFETPPTDGPEPAVQLWPLQYQPRLADAAGDAAGYTETSSGTGWPKNSTPAAISLSPSS